MIGTLQEGPTVVARCFTGRRERSCLVEGEVLTSKLGQRVNCCVLPDISIRLWSHYSSRWCHAAYLD